MPKPALHGVRIDIESRSAIPIKAGAYRYSECPKFKVLLISYSPLRRYAGGTIRPGQPRALDLKNKSAVASFQKLLVNPDYEKHAYNANFERIALSRWLGMGTGTYIDPLNWHCSAVKANVAGVFGDLDEVARAVRSPVSKDKEGRRLIKLFSIPDNKTGRFHKGLAEECWCCADHRRDFARFSEYCTQDVKTEAVVAAQFPDMSPEVQAQYEADQRINDRGVLHFRELSEAAVSAVKTDVDRLMLEMKRLTGVDNPNSGPQVQGWLERQGYPMDSLAKASREEALADPFCPDIVKEVLTLKGSANLTSVSKHTTMLRDRSAVDGRIRGALQFYGAHTGREAGRGFQPQNLPRYEAPEEDRKRLLKGKAKAKHNIPLIAKGSVRAALIPAPGHVFVVPDYNAIEARCLGWQAGEKWVQDEFRGEGKIYEATAHHMFGVDKAALVAALKRCGKCGKCLDCIVRGQGKVSDLALGYQGGAGALVTMGAADAGIDVGNYPDLKAEWERLGSPGKFWEWEKERHDYPELIRLRDLYRDNRPATVRFWKLCAAAWDQACKGERASFGPDGRIVMVRDGRHNRLILPSGRSIWYRFARAHEDPDYDRIDRRTFIGKAKGRGHARIDTHGGKLTENITQAIARDALFDLIMKIERKTDKGWPARLVLHVHDEVVLEVPERHAEQVLADTLGMMDKTPKWAPGLLLKGEGAIMERYGK